jgi:hypothetical protein
MLGVMPAIRLEIQGVVILPALTQEGSGVRARFHFSHGSCGRGQKGSRVDG